jgi:hypothetical protein
VGADDVPDAEFIEIARATSCADFVARHRFLFLWGLGRLFPHTDDKLKTQLEGVLRDPKAQPLELLVHRVRKTTDVDPEMITVGRAPSNDIVIDDSTVSKSHAWFRERGPRLELVDAGSRNGTWVGSLRLPPRGSPVGIPVGQLLRFGLISFRLLDAEGLWRAIKNT